MVVQGGFSLQLIDAETQQPLNEYRGPSGSVYYAEASPGGEYFLRFQVLQDAVKSGDKAANDKQRGSAAKHEETMMYYFRPAVDGKDLGFYTNLTKSQGARDVGLWTYVNGIGTNQALKFETAAAAVTTTNGNKQSDGAAAGATAVSEEESGATAATATKTTPPPRLHMGNVQVRISKGVFTGYQKRVYTSIPALTQQETVMAAEAAAPISASSSLQEEEDEAANGATNKAAEGAPPAPMMMNPVPILRSREGAAKFQQKFTEECPTYQPGELLETITIHYGSQQALIQAGILAPFPGMVPQYVGVPPPPPPPPTTSAYPPTTSAAIVAPTSTASNTKPTASGTSPVPQGKVLVPNPLLDVSSSASGVKRLHSATSTAGNANKKEAATNTSNEIKPPATKKPCHGVAASKNEPAVVVASSSATVVSK